MKIAIKKTILISFLLLSFESQADIAQLVSGSEHTCSLINKKMECVGNPYYGNDLHDPTQITNVATTNDVTCVVMEKKIECFGTTQSKMRSGFDEKRYNSKTVKQLIGSYDSFCSLTYMGEVDCIHEYVLSLSKEDKLFAKLQKKLGPIEEISVSSGYACAISKAGVLQCEGSYPGGSTIIVNDLVPTQLKNPRQLQAGFAHTCVLTDNGVVCWGDPKLSPEVLDIPKDLGQPSQIVSGAQHMCALTDGSVKCWGNNQYKTAEAPKNLGYVREIAVGRGYNCVRVDSSVQCWGESPFYKDILNIPEDLPPVLKLFGGLDGMMCALTEKGLRCWGNGKYGYSKNPKFFDSNSLENVLKIASGNRHNCSLIKKGVTCSGDNTYDQLNVPYDLKNPVSIVSGSNTTCAFTDEGLKCWGAEHFSGGRYQSFQLPLNIKTPTALAIGIPLSCAVEKNVPTCWTQKDAVNGIVRTVSIPSELLDEENILTGFSIKNNFICGYFKKEDLFSPTTMNSICWSVEKNDLNTPIKIQKPADLANYPIIAVPNDRNNVCAIIDNSIRCWDSTGEYTLKISDLSEPKNLSIEKSRLCALVNEKIKCWPF